MPEQDRGASVRSEQFAFSIRYRAPNTSTEPIAPGLSEVTVLRTFESMLHDPYRVQFLCVNTTARKRLSTLRPAIRFPTPPMVSLHEARCFAASRNTCRARGYLLAGIMLAMPVASFHSTSAIQPRAYTKVKSLRMGSCECETLYRH